MLKIKTNLVLDENKKPYAVQLSIKDFERIEEALENYGLARLMDEPESEPPLELQEAKKYYRTLRKSNVAR
ncbi:MAG TPA: hypothetical protein VKX17_04855 [Planctomycetota bacterium]|nr:hypothetical protein [Planctomycetota bacterium]